MTKVYTKQVPIYDWATTRLILTDNVEKHIQKCFLNVANKKTMQRVGQTILDDNVITTVLNYENQEGTIGHEAVHVGMHILHRSGVRFNRSIICGKSTKNDEALAYLVGYLVNWIHGRIKFSRAPA